MSYLIFNVIIATDNLKSIKKDTLSNRSLNNIQQLSNFIQFAKFEITSSNLKFAASTIYKIFLNKAMPEAVRWHKDLYYVLVFKNRGLLHKR